MPSVDCKVYVGDLGSSASKQDLEEVFSQYGRLSSVWVARNPPGFAFVEFDDSRDAEDAVRALDGRSICGRRVRVELSTGRSRGGGGGGGGGGRFGGGLRGGGEIRLSLVHIHTIFGPFSINISFKFMLHFDIYFQTFFGNFKQILIHAQNLCNCV
ncbi:hypothetical protein HAZT_HAZT010353 [Hyalella azteca]|uniref:RRM domain-containing protein n=1 Tax=Hyalella azteca TaxID=294128 RepID=A0A6A0H2F1_HYAAZ|nr:hypothetical protein HAZT_HAZT010353 [Hyalella azteca]